MVFHFRYLLVLVGFVFTFNSNAQHLFFKQVNDSILKSFPDSASKKVKFVGLDSLQYRPLMNYILGFYPTMKYKSITLKTSSSKSPLSVRPTFWSIFKGAEKRNYTIFISTGTTSMIDSILLYKLSLNSKVGVLGHETSHIYDYSTNHFFHFVSLFLNQVSRKKMNQEEYATDKLTVEQGLGYQLLSWSIEVREKLKIENWQGVKGYESHKRNTEERYMNPETIRHFINDFPIYVQQLYK
jgi:hypothetical protein